MATTTHRGALLGISITALGGIGLLGAASGATAEEPQPVALADVQYVALGDSYASGFGVAPYSDAPAPGCFQSEVDYPHRAAAALELELLDVSCAGAVTANIIDTPQTTITGQGIAQPQSDVLSPETDFVTVMIGGNDIGFTDILPGCFAASAAGPLLANPAAPNCVSSLAPDGGTDQLMQRLVDTVEPALDATLVRIAERAPDAKVLVVGYPTIFPDPEDTPPGGCFSSATGTGAPPFPENAFPFTDADTVYFNRIQTALDEATAAIAAAHGAEFLTTMEQTEGHSPCAGTTDPWVSGITFTQLSPEPDVALGVLHPNEAGLEFLATRVTEALRSAFPPPPAPDGGSSTPAAQLPETGPAIDPVLAFAGLLLGLGATATAAARRRSRSGA